MKKPTFILLMLLLSGSLANLTLASNGGGEGDSPGGSSSGGGSSAGGSSGGGSSAGGSSGGGTAGGGSNGSSGGGSVNSGAESNYSSSSNYAIGQRVFFQKLYCKTCPLSDLALERDAVIALIPLLEKDGEIGKLLSYRERYAVRYFFQKRFNL